MNIQMMLLIFMFVIFVMLPILIFAIKTAVKKGILEAYDIIRNKNDKNNYD